MVKRNPAFRELEPALKSAVARGAIVVAEYEAHSVESAARPDLPLLELLRELSAGATLPRERGAMESECEQRLDATLRRDFPERRGRASDNVDVRPLAAALPRCPARYL
jgi:hypothetical protein